MRIWSAGLTFPTDHVEVGLADAAGGRACVEHVVFGADDAVALEVVVAGVTEAVDSVPSAVRWATDTHAFSSSHDCPEGTDIAAGVVVEDGVTDAVRADAPCNDEVVKADVVDCGGVDGPDLQHEGIFERGGERDGIGGVEAERTEPNQVAFKTLDRVAGHLDLDDGAQEVLLYESLRKEEAYRLRLEDHETAKNAVEHCLAIAAYSCPGGGAVVGGCLSLHAHRRPLRRAHVEARQEGLRDKRGVGSVLAWVLEVVVDGWFASVVSSGEGLTNLDIVSIRS